MLKRRLYAAAVLALVAGACKSTYSHPQDSVAAVAPGRLESAYRSLLKRPPLLQAPLTMLPRINRQQRLLPQLRQATEFVRRQIPEVATLFDADAGVDENITILLHTERVLSVLAEQWPYYPDPPTRSLRGQSIDAATVLAYAVVAHDLGKGVAVERGEGTEAQKKYVPTAVEAVLRTLALTDLEVKIGTTIMSDDLLGETAQSYDEQRAAEAARSIAAQAADCDLSVADYYALREAFLKADASSYQTIRRRFFIALAPDDKTPIPLDQSRDPALDHTAEVAPAGGRLVTKDGNLEKFAALVAQQAARAGATANDAGAQADSPDERSGSEQTPETTDSDRRSGGDASARR